MKNLIKTILLLFLVFFFSACATVNLNHSKPEMSLPDNYTGPRKTFNQLNGSCQY
jgi:hypothetical protein